MHTLEGHIGTVIAAAFSPDDKLLASGSADQTVRLWDTETGALLQVLRIKYAVASVAFSPGGELLACACGYGYSSSCDDFYLWETATGIPVRELKGHRGPVLSLCFFSGNLLATTCADCKIRVWDWTKGLLIRTLEGHTHYNINSVSYVPGGLLASVSDDKSLRLWDPWTGETLWIATHPCEVLLVSSSECGLLATASKDCIVRLWNPQTGVLTHTLDFELGDITYLAFSPSGLLAVGSSSKSLQLWDPKKKRD